MNTCNCPSCRSNHCNRTSEKPPLQGRSQKPPLQREVKKATAAKGGQKSHRCKTKATESSPALKLHPDPVTTAAAIKTVAGRPRGEGHDSEAPVTCTPRAVQGSSDNERCGSAPNSRPQSPSTPPTRSSLSQISTPWTTSERYLGVKNSNVHTIQSVR